MKYISLQNELNTKVPGNAPNIDDEKQDRPGAEDDKNKTYYPVSEQSLVDYVLYEKLDPYTALILIIKMYWEIYLNNLFNIKHSVPESEGLKAVRNDEDEESAESEAVRFKPDTGRVLRVMHRIFAGSINGESSETNPGRTGLTDREIEILVQEIVLLRIFFHSVTSPTVAAFIEKKTDEAAKLIRASAAKQKEFWIAKCVWIEIQEDIAELLLILESTRLSNGYAVREFLKIFGDIYVKMKEQVYKLLDVQRRIMLKEKNPQWSKEDIEAKVKELESDEEAEMKKLRVDSDLVSVLEEIKPGKSIDEAELTEYRKKVKKTLRDIFFLIHPHRLAHHPKYGNLTPEQKEHLAKLWDNVMEIRQIELRYPEGTVGRGFHSLEKLDDIRSTTKKIMEHSGLDINIDYIIQGETIEDQIEWLNKEIEQLEKDSQNIKSEIIVLSNDEDTREKKAIIGCVEKHKQIREEMIAKTDEIGREARELETRFHIMLTGDEEG